jgi:hypothetical protein
LYQALHVVEYGYLVVHWGVHPVEREPDVQIPRERWNWVW